MSQKPKETVSSFNTAGITCYKETETRAKNCLLDLAAYKSLVSLLKSFQQTERQKSLIATDAGKNGS